MIDYFKSFAVMVLLNMAGLFALGFVLGIFMVIGGMSSAQMNNVEGSAWLNILILLCWPVISFFAFKFSVDKFLIKTDNK